MLEWFTEGTRKDQHSKEEELLVQSTVSQAITLVNVYYIHALRSLLSFSAWRNLTFSS